MRATQGILAALAATCLATATDKGLNLFTFPEGSGLNGTVSIDPAAMAEISDIASYTFPEGSGLNGTVSIDMCAINEKMGQLVAAAGNASNETVSLMAGGGPTRDECEECHKLCIFLCFIPPACVWCLVNCANKGCYPGQDAPRRGGA